MGLFGHGNDCTRVERERRRGSFGVKKNTLTVVQFLDVKYILKDVVITIIKVVIFFLENAVQKWHYMLQIS